MSYRDTRVYPFSLVLLSVRRAVLFYPFDFENEKKGKRKMKKILALVLTMSIVCVLMASCSVLDTLGISSWFGYDDTKEEVSVWDNAKYSSDTELGTGAKTVQVEVKAEGKSVTFTIHTDKEILGDALVEHGLVAGEQGAYGLYVKFVNGIEADYDKDQTYWALYKNGEYMMTGVDMTVFSDGEHYELSKEK